MGSIRYSEDSGPEIELKNLGFDWDVYKILEKFVFGKCQKVRVRRLNAEEKGLLLGGPA